MNNNEILINTLNDFSNGIYMGIDTTENAISKIQDVNYKNELTNIKETYENHARIIAHEVENLGGNPQLKTKLWSKGVEFMNSLKSLAKDTDKELIPDSYYNCKTGIIMEEKFLTENKENLNHKYQLIIENMIDEDKNQLKKLEKSMNTALFN